MSAVCRSPIWTTWTLSLQSSSWLSVSALVSSNTHTHRRNMKLEYFIFINIWWISHTDRTVSDCCWLITEYHLHQIQPLPLTIDSEWFQQIVGHPNKRLLRNSQMEFTITIIILVCYSNQFSTICDSPLALDGVPWFCPTNITVFQ